MESICYELYKLAHLALSVLVDLDNMHEYLAEREICVLASRFGFAVGVIASCGP